MEEKEAPKGEDDWAVLVWLDSKGEVDEVERGVRPRRGAGSPQTDCGPLTDREAAP